MELFVRSQLWFVHYISRIIGLNAFAYCKERNQFRVSQFWRGYALVYNFYVITPLVVYFTGIISAGCERTFHREDMLSAYQVQFIEFFLIFVLTKTTLNFTYIMLYTADILETLNFCAEVHAEHSSLFKGRPSGNWGYYIAILGRLVLLQIAIFVHYKMSVYISATFFALPMLLPTIVVGLFSTLLLEMKLDILKYLEDIVEDSGRAKLDSERVIALYRNTFKFQSRLQKLSTPTLLQEFGVELILVSKMLFYLCMEPFEYKKFFEIGIYCSYTLITTRIFKKFNDYDRRIKMLFTLLQFKRKFFTKWEWRMLDVISLETLIGTRDEFSVNNFSSAERSLYLRLLGLSWSNGILYANFFLSGAVHIFCVRRED